jgi:DNA-binding Xre family transcriptional regulator
MNLDDYLHQLEYELNVSCVNLSALSRDAGVSYTLLRELKAGKRKNITVATLSAIQTKLREPLPGKFCETCRAYETTEGGHYCISINGNSSEKPTACYMHRPL